MALQNINTFEQHVEKIVLGVAVIGAGFMAWLAQDSVGIANPSQPDAKIHPKEIEPEIAKQLRANDAGRAKRQDSPVPDPLKGVDFVGGYEEYAYGNPVGRDVLAARTPQFGPKNLALNFRVDAGAGDVTYKSIVPEAPAPEMVHATVLQKQVVVQPQLDAQGQVVLPPAGQVYKNVEVRNVVAIDGYIPVGKFVLDLNSPTDTKQTFVPNDLRRGLVYRIRVKRSEQLPGGKWGDYKVIDASKGSTPPTEILPTPLNMTDGALQGLLPEIDQQFQQIQLPTYFWDASGMPVQPPILTKPVPPAVVQETADLHSKLQKYLQGNTGFGAAPGVVPGMPGGVVGPGGAATQPAALPTSIPEIQKLEVQPFAFWDDDVKPNHHYRYEVQVELVNPGYGWKYGLADQAYKLVPVIPVKDEGFVKVPEEVAIHSDMAFFVQGLEFPLKNKVLGSIFFQDNNGRSYTGTYAVEKGVNVSGTLPTGMGASKEVDTSFTVVDFYEMPLPGAPGNIRVILRDPNGILIIRDSAADGNSPDKTDWQDRVVQGAAAAAAAATQPGVGPVAPTVTPGPVVGPAVSPGRGPATTPTPPPTATRRGPVTGTPIQH